MTIETRCDECGANLRFKDESAGRLVHCRSCSAEVVVPDRSQKQSARKSSIHPLVYVGAGCAIFAAITVGIAVYGFFKLRQTIAEAQQDAANKQEVAVVARPTPPLQIAEPASPSFQINGEDLREIDPAELRAIASSLMEKKRHAEAAQVQYWAVKNGDGEGQYNLACYLSLSGNIEPAFYWLQVAALDEGVDAAWAEQDPDLVPLRGDSRWGVMRNYLRQANDYWRTSDIKVTTLIKPQSVTPGEPIPVVVGLHGMGSNPQNLVDESLQDFADKHRIALVGVSGTIPNGRRSFIWSEGTERDRLRVEQALTEVADRVTPAPGKIILFGFSQGAKMSVEIAVRDSQKFAGAIALSPGGNSLENRAIFTPGAAQKQTFVISVGAGELFGNKKMASNYATLAKSAGGNVEHIINPDQPGHTFPPNFETEFERWVLKILAGR